MINKIYNIYNMKMQRWVVISLLKSSFLQACKATSKEEAPVGMIETLKRYTYRGSC